MGFKTELNWALKLKEIDEVEVDKEYSFSKDEYRVYPIDIPIDLINKSWEVIAKVLVREFKNVEGKTTGKYKVLRVYERDEKEILTKNIRETVSYIKKEEITDFDDIKVS